MKAILSVHNKSGLAEFAQGLAGLGFELYSTGGTQKALEQAGLRVTGISQLTGFPEILDGRVKTLHPRVFGGILARRELAEHRRQLEVNAISFIDLVCVNLYPFRETVSRPGVTLEEALENIDIGGPSLLRAAAKNYPWVLVVVDPQDYPQVLAALRQGEVGMDFRHHLAWKAFQHTASYDSLIARYLSTEEFPERVTIPLKKALDLRYGENPHQRAAYYLEEAFAPLPELGGLKQLAGKELSYNNLLDIDAAMAAVAEFTEPAVVVVKHTNPCGLSVHPDLAEAYRRALAGDPVAAFGGVLAANRPLDEATATEVTRTHYDIIIAPGFAPPALSLLSKGNTILLQGTPAPPQGWQMRRAGAGALVQTPDTFSEAEFSPRVVSKRAPTPQEMDDLRFGWRVVKHIKSNAIALVREQALLGMGAGQPSRVQSVEIAVRKAGERARGTVLASDAFFPFPDGVEAAARAGVTAIIQPGGSVRDRDAVDTADSFGMAMVFTGVRHFRH